MNRSLQSNARWKIGKPADRFVAASAMDAVDSNIDLVSCVRVLAGSATASVDRHEADRSQIRGISTTALTPNQPLYTSHLASRISHLASRISHLASRISHLASRISHLASRISHLASRISHLASRISHLASRISHLASRISHLASRIASRISHLASRISHLASRISSCPPAEHSSSLI